MLFHTKSELSIYVNIDQVISLEFEMEPMLEKALRNNFYGNKL